MSNPVIGTETFYVHPDAHEVHDAGLSAGLRGDFTEAHEGFAAAQKIMEAEPQTLATKLQVARIGRDAGFTCVREAIATNDIALIERSNVTIHHYNAPFVEASVRKQGELSATARREALAEQGATINLLGRTATVTQVMMQNMDAPTAKIRRAAKDARESYEKAHELLVGGNNGYYRVSNAMTAARHERLNGQALKAAAWVGRAATGLAWTIANDRRNIGAAVRTAGSRARHLVTRGAATRSVKTAP